MLIDEKNAKLQVEKDNKTLERINYFPFTHGDLIEKQRHVLAELQKQELLNNFKDREAEKNQKKREEL